MGKRGGVRTTNKQLRARDDRRNIGAELLEAIRDVKAGRVGARHQIKANDVLTTRLKTGFSQREFADALQISPRTLQHWEQGNRRPSGAAATLLLIVARYPNVLREVASRRKAA
jgi:putative transcriptional regulator